MCVFVCVCVCVCVVCVCVCVYAVYIYAFSPTHPKKENDKKFIITKSLYINDFNA